MDKSFAAPFGYAGLSDKDDSVLVATAKHDQIAFGVLYHRYVPRVYRYLRTRTNTDEDAADLTQQVFTQALAALPKYRECGVPFAAWLFRIAANIATDAKRRERPTVEWETIPESEHPLMEQSVEGAVLQHEAIAHLRTLLADLDPVHREVILLRFIANLTVREIASVLERSEATIYRQLSYALNTLKERYDDV